MADHPWSQRRNHLTAIGHIDHLLPQATTAWVSVVTTSTRMTMLTKKTLLLSDLFI